MQCLASAVLLLTLLGSSCSSGPGLFVELPNGERMEILNTRWMRFPEEEGATVIVSYRTAMDLEDRESLQQEAALLWAVLQTHIPDLEQSAILQPTVETVSIPGFQMSTSHNLLFRKSPEGQWDLLP